MNIIILRRDGARDLKFTGELIGEDDSSPENCGHSGIARDATRWTKYSIYRTTAGKLIGAIVHKTCWQGEHDRYDARVCATPEELADYLGHSPAAKRAIDNAGLEIVEDIE